MRHHEQEMLVLVDRFNPSIGRIVGTVGAGAAKVAQLWCCVLPAGTELPGGVGLHVWRGWVDIEQTFPVLVETADDEGSWRRATLEDMERFCLPLCEEAELEIAEEPDEREGKWCWTRTDLDEPEWNGFFFDRDDAIRSGHHVTKGEVGHEFILGQVRVFHPSQEFYAQEVADGLRHMVWQTALARLGEAADTYLNGLNTEDVAERLAEAVRRELCRPEWRLDGFWVGEETSGKEASELPLLGGL